MFNHLKTLALITAAIQIQDLSAHPTDSLHPRPNELQEVIVTARRPEAIIRADRITYIPSASISGSQGNLLEAIKALPGITVSNKGDFMLNGMQGLSVLIDGRKSILTGDALVNYLQSLPVTEIDNIEIINTPGARRAGSDPIISLNIRRRRKREKGYSTTANLNSEAGKARKMYASANVELNNSNGNLSFNYSTFLKRDPSELVTDRPYLDYQERLLQKYDRVRHDAMHFVSLSYDYKTDRPISAGISLNYNYHRRREPAVMRTTVPFVNEPTVTSNNARFRTGNIYGGIYLNRDLSGREGKWTAACDFFRHTNSERQFMNDNTGTDLEGDMCGHTLGIVGTFDWRYTLSANWTISSGLRLSYVKLDSDGNYSSTETDGTLSPDGLGSSFGYEENVNAIYAEGTASYDRLKITAGIRAEQSNLSTSFSGNESALPHDMSDKSFHIYPSLSLSLNSSPESSWLLSYACKVTRPRFADLDPFIHVFDDITHVGGNINLKESTAHSLSIAWSDNRSLRFLLSATNTSGEIVKCYRELTDKVVYVTPENFPRHLQILLSASCGDIRLTGWGNIMANAGLIYSGYRLPAFLNTGSNNLFTPMFEIRNSLTLPFAISAEIKLSFRGPVAFGQARASSVWNTYIGIRRRFYNGRISISAYVKDIFNTNHSISTIYLSGRKATLCEKEFEDMRKIGLSISYRFSGGQRKKDKADRNIWIEELNRVNL